MSEAPALPEQHRLAQFTGESSAFLPGLRRYGARLTLGGTCSCFRRPAPPAGCLPGDVGILLQGGPGVSAPALPEHSLAQVDLLDFVAWLADAGRVSMRNTVPGYISGINAADSAFGLPPLPAPRGSRPGPSTNCLPREAPSPNQTCLKRP